MDADVVEQILDPWRYNNATDLVLLEAIPAQGLAAVPLASRGRTIAAQFAHLHNNRWWWLKYNHALPAKLKLFPRRAQPSRTQLAAALKASGAAVENCLRERLSSGAKVKSFRGNPVRWMSYMMTHDAHHRGQILLALKQNGMRVPLKTAQAKLWGMWIWGSLEAKKKKSRKARP